MEQKTENIKIFRVVTVSNCVPWHLSNFLEKSCNDFKVYVLGDNVSVHSRQYKDIVFIDIPIARKISVWNDIRALLLLCFYCIKYRPNVIHSIMPKAGLLSAIAGFITCIPCRFHTFTGQVWFERRGFFRKFLIFLDKLIVFLNTECLTDSPSQSEFLYKNGIRNKKMSLRCLGKGALNGVDQIRFDKNRLTTSANQLSNELGLTSENFVFAFIARKNYMKGIRELFQAFAIISIRYPFARLLYVGPEDKGYENSTEILFQKFDIDRSAVINVNQSVNNHETYLAISNVLCLPSYREGFGSIVIDAATLGVPTIGTKIVGLIDSVEDKVTGLLVSVESVDELVQAMECLINDVERLSLLSKNAEIRAKKYFSADYIYSLQKDFYSGYLKHISITANHWLCSFKAYGDLVIACNVLNRITKSEQWGLIYGSYNRDLLQALDFQGKAVELELGNEVPAAYNLKKEGFWKGFKSAWRLKWALDNLHFEKDILLFDRLIKRTRFVSRSYQTEDVFQENSNIYKDYFRYFGLPEYTPEFKIPNARKVYFFPNAREPHRIIPQKTLNRWCQQCLDLELEPTIYQIEKNTPSNPAPYTQYIYGFDTLVNKIKEADIVVSADSLPAHIAEYYQKPIFVGTPKRKDDFMPYSALVTGAIAFFDDESLFQNWLKGLLRR